MAITISGAFDNFHDVFFDRVANETEMARTRRISLLNRLTPSCFCTSVAPEEAIDNIIEQEFFSMLVPSNDDPSMIHFNGDRFLGP